MKFGKRTERNKKLMRIICAILALLIAAGTLSTLFYYL
jgi:hypothetical protein